MNELLVDDELVGDYLAECRDHLATIEADLLSVEQAGADIDEQLVNRVFRAAHSIKGGAGFFDLTQIKDLAHKTENVLDMIRSRRMVPTPEVVSVLLLAFDKLRELLSDFRSSNQADIASFVEALLQLTRDHLPAEQRASVNQQVAIPLPGPGKPIEASALDLEQARAGGRQVYLIECDLIHDVQRRGQTPYRLLHLLLEHGNILETVFDLDSAGTLDEEPSNRLQFQVLYASESEAATVAGVLDLPPERIRPVEAPAGVPPKAPEPPVKAAAPAAPTAAAPTAAAPTDTVRLNVSLLDSLMTLAGELVLSRNQLNESLARQDARGIRTGAQRVSQVSSELQEVVSLTRMQPVGTVFAKFPRLVRDLARDLGKEAQLKLEGGDVELDKTILEGLSDPLTHMVRNSVDHGIEPPDERARAGKPRCGTVTLRASHQAGQVAIEIADDGKGLDPARVAASSLSRGLVTPDQLARMSDREKMALIMLPGVSTAKAVSDVSGRGVGMDVVKTNLDKLGGKMEIDSVPGSGTTFHIKLPLTLAIIPSLLISGQGQKFAIPQANVRELIRIPAGQITQRIDRVGDAEVLILRDRLVPLLRLSEPGDAAWNIVLVDTGAFEYGLVVEELHDTVEIVVKPLGRHLKRLSDYAGATILGDGRVALILDVAGFAARAGLTPAEKPEAAHPLSDDAPASGDSLALLLFHNAPDEVCALPSYLVARVERIAAGRIEHLGGRRTMQYRGASLPVLALSDVAGVGQVDESQAWVVIVFEHAGRTLGLLAAEPLDMIETALDIDRQTLRQPGIAGSAVIKGRTTLIVDVQEIVEATLSPAETGGPEAERGGPPAAMPTVLLAEDSDFFRGQLIRLIEGLGCHVLAAPDGQAAWELLDAHAGEVGLVTTDIEMPRLDGLSLTRRIRADARFGELPVIAVSTLADEEEVARGLAAGVTEYQVKLNKDELAKSIRKVLVPLGIETEIES
jgi:two-component system, chemotaxis family, sensor kinase CheA